MRFVCDDICCTLARLRKKKKAKKSRDDMILDKKSALIYYAVDHVCVMLYSCFRIYIITKT